MGYIRSSFPTLSLIIPHTEDQQRINTFSKLNTRVRSLAEKMNNLKVSVRDWEFARAVLISNSLLQQEKEALDDLAMELELADEDQPVLYVRTHPRKLFHAI
jgi:prefoldin subunit 4